MEESERGLENENSKDRGEIFCRLRKALNEFILCQLRFKKLMILSINEQGNKI